MSKSFTLNKIDLLAISRFAAVKDIRYYLNGILLEVGNRESRLVATAGHCLGALRLESVSHEACTTPEQYIIPTEAVLRFKPKKGTGDTVTLTVEPKQSTGQQYATLEDATGSKYTFPLIDGRFPDYRRVIPSRCQGTAGHFNPEILMSFVKASKDLGSSAGMIHIAQNERDAALVFIPDDRFVGVVTQRRTQELEKDSSPAWAQGSLSETVEALAA